MSRLIAYRRVSTDGQGDSGLGLEAQAAAITGYCGLYGHEVVRDVAEVGSGRKVEGRAGLLGALREVRDGAVDGIIVAKLDRLSRSVRDLGRMVDEVFMRRGMLVSVGEHVDTGSAIGRFTLTLLSSLAQLEAEQVGERTRAALAARRARGMRVNGGVPYGWTDGPDGRLVPVEAEQRALRVARGYRVAGLSWAKTARKMNEEGWKTRRGGEWGHGHLAKAVQRDSEVRAVLGSAG